ncbi:MAG: aconitate hydratase [Lentisphaerae bacterium]|nr:aconitate hydratase [Lentisphaerota bacterium]
MSAQTLIEKIIAQHLVEGECKPGAEVKIRIDQTLCQDATGTMAFLELEALGIDRVKTELSIQYVDHNTGQMGPENPNDHLYLQSVCANKGVLFSRPGNGICHQVHLERYGIPGKTLLGADSHTPTGGGIGMLAIGAGGLDVALAMAGKPFKLTFPRVIGIRLTGQLQPWVAAKDVILTVLSILGSKGNVGTAIEYFGPGVESLSVPERATITNMGAELGATTSIFPSDNATRAFLQAEGRLYSWRPLAADSDAVYDRVIDIDLTSVVPMAACPSNPGNVKPVAEIAGIAVSQVAIGSCTNSSLKDLRMVAQTIKGKTVSPEVSLAIAPGSRQVLAMLSADGSLADMVTAGCRILEAACGPCIGQGFSPADGTVSVRTFNRNFLNRTGTKNDQSYLVSPETAVATALTGKITDPRTLGIEYPKWEMPERFLIDDGMVIVPPPAGSAAPIIRKETIGEPPSCTPLPDDIDAEVLIKVGDKITTDHIMPAGAFLKYRSNIPKYARYVFDCFNQEGQPSFADRALAVRDSGRIGLIVAGDSFGQGSSREHAAICPMYLGVRLVLAINVERILAANLVNFGILPLLFQNPADLEAIQPGQKLTIAGLRAQLAPGKTIAASLTDADGNRRDLTLKHNLSPEDIATVLQGGKLGG